MTRSTCVTVGAMSLAALVAVALGADEPAKRAESVKPPWQRQLQGEDAKKAAEQESRLPKLLEAGKYDEALRAVQTLADLRARIQGKDHWQSVYARVELDAIRRVLRAKKEDQKNYNRALFTLQPKAFELFAQGYYREAQSYFDQVLAVCRQVLGEEHPHTATGYVWVALNLHAQGRFKEAEAGYRRALATYRKLLGEHFPQTATVYDKMAMNLKGQGKFQEAEEGFRKALSICVDVFGEEHPDTAACYDALSANLSAEGKYKEAEEGFRNALYLRRKALGEDHPNTALSHGKIAANFIAQGKYLEAEASLRDALSIYRRVLGEDDTVTARSYNALALDLNNQGKYREAEEGLRRALLIRLKALGEKNALSAISYNNLAYNLNAQGKYKEAEEGSYKALAIYRLVLGERHPYTATSYESVAANLHAQGKYAEAEAAFRKALAIRTKAFGEEHPLTATSYNNLGYNLNAQGKFKEAEEDQSKALLIRRRVLGDDHSHTAVSYFNLGSNLLSQGRHKEAEEDFRKALDIRRKLHGEEHPDTARSYEHLAIALHAQAKYTEAESEWLHAAASFTKSLLHVAVTGLERATFTSEPSPLPALAAVLARNGKPEDAWQRFEEGYTHGPWNDLTARLRRPKAERDEQAQLTARIARLNEHLAAITSDIPTSDRNKLRDELQNQLRQAYQELTTFSQQLQKQYGAVGGQVFSRAQIQESLATDAALVGWVDVPSRPKSVDSNGEHWAVLLRSSGTPVWVRLPGSGNKGAWTDADAQLAGRLRSVLHQAESAWQPLAERLRKQRLDPLVPHLKGVRRLIVLPSATLAGVPLEVLAEAYRVSYTPSGTMHAYLTRLPNPTGKGLLAVADPVYAPPAERDKPPPLPPSGVLLMMVTPGSNAADAGLKADDVILRYGEKDLKVPTAFLPEPESADRKKTIPVVVWRDGRALPRPLFVRTGILGVMIAKEPAAQALAERRHLELVALTRGGDGDWKPLPGSRMEAAALQRLFSRDDPVKLLQGSDASEERLNDLAQRGELGKYRYIHLAAHVEVLNTMPLRSALILARDRLPDAQQRAELLLSAKPIPDGRLTVEEALQSWNLHSDLVTLPACQSALGKYERGEGFAGLAQALLLCGTRSVCLSLWNGNATATALLMERFYQNLLGKREGLGAPMAKAAALEEAKSWLRTLPRWEVMKRAGALSEGISRSKSKVIQAIDVPAATEKTKVDDCPFAHPYYWAAFVLIGHAY